MNFKEQLWGLCIGALQLSDTQTLAHGYLGCSEPAVCCSEVSALLVWHVAGHTGDHSYDDGYHYDEDYHHRDDNDDYHFE